MNTFYNLSYSVFIFLGLAAVFPYVALQAGTLDKLTYHNDRKRSGWNKNEAQLTPNSVSSSSFRQLWQTQQFDSVDGVEPRLFASPLYVNDVAITAHSYAGQHFSVIFAATDIGYVYAINAFPVDDIPAGTILWKCRVSAKKPGRGNLSTPVIDRRNQRLYTIANEGEKPYSVHALDLRNGEAVNGWPVTIDTAAVNAPGVSKNGTTEFPRKRPHVQRGALNLSPDQSRLYVAFGGDYHSGWIVSVDTIKAAVVSSFSTTARTEERQGGMWASGGPSIDGEGFIHIASGASVRVFIQKMGMPGVFPNSEHNWGQSVLRLRDDPKMGFELVGTYSPFNWAQAQVMDIDLGSSGTVVIDLDPATTATPHLLVAGGKQGNVYLLDREHMPGSLVKRPNPTYDSTADGSLYSPKNQPQFGQPGPVNVFGPYADKNAMGNQARSRTTAAYFHSETGNGYIFVSGSAKAGEKVDQSTPPGLARLKIVTSPGLPAYLEIDQLEGTQVFQNPGSPIITSNGGRDAIVWVLDSNAPRTSSLYGPNSPRPVLYAFDALNFQLLWKSLPGELATSGKYNEPAIVRGQVIVGTDRIQVFGLATDPNEPRIDFPPIFDNTAQDIQEVTYDPQAVQAGKLTFSQRCAACHATGMLGVPPLDAISNLEKGKIIDSLLNGSMKLQAVGLDAVQVASLATYLKSLPPTLTSTTPMGKDKLNLVGRALYVKHCINCHMPDGFGVRSLQPALQGSELVKGEPSALVRMILYGSEQTKELEHTYGSTMSHAEMLDLVSYVRQAFGPNKTTIQLKDAVD